MKMYVSSLNLPIGYVIPRFPALYWPLGPDFDKYQDLFLFYSVDMWRFVLYWTLIFFVSAYSCAGLSACFNMYWRVYRERQVVGGTLRKLRIRPFMVLISYVLLGCFHGFSSGALVGLMVLAIYRAGSLSMTTWIPFCWGAAQLFYHIASSYLTSLLLM